MADQPPGKVRDAWDKADIILKPIGGLLTALAVAIVGFWTSNYLKNRESQEAASRERMETRDTNARLYSELISKREESESALRKDMFRSIIESFLRPGSTSLEERVLNLELLVYNFHESLNLKPLFLHIQRKIEESPEKKDYQGRLNRVAGEISKKQMLVLQEGGKTFDSTVDLKTLSFVGRTGDAEDSSTDRDLTVDGVRRNFKLEILSADKQSQELDVRLTIRTPDAQPSAAAGSTSTEFWIGYFDFPMIDNTRLSNDQRCAIVLNNFDAKEETADMTLVYFPGKYAGLREKPYYDEVVAKLLAAGASGAAVPSPAR